jgi:hypothetical protein
MIAMTDPDLLTDQLEDLEFDTICEADISWFVVLFGRRFQSPLHAYCDLPAHWIGTLPCCGYVVLLCDPHRYDHRLGYSHCGHRWLNGNLTWSKI